MAAARRSGLARDGTRAGHPGKEPTGKPYETNGRARAGYGFPTDPEGGERPTMRSLQLFRTPGATAGCLLAAALALPAGSAAQERPDSTTVALVGTVYDSTRAGPLGRAAVYLMDTPHVTAADSLGRFAFVDLEVGAYVVSVRHPRLDSLGVTMPPRWRIEVEPGVNRADLAIPSMAALLPELCESQPESSDGGAVLGSVRDGSTGTLLPEARVEFVAGSVRRVVEADHEGRYVACGLPTSTRILARASFLDHAPSETWLTLEPDEWLHRTFELDIAQGAPVAGTLADRETGEPVDGALVEVESADGVTRRAFTDENGRFQVGRLDLETYLVRVEHLAYGKQTRWFTISGLEPVTLEMAVAPQALELEGLTVTVSSPAVERLERSGVRADVLGRPEIEELLGSAQSIADLVRELPGVRVRQDLDPTTGQPRVCIEARRTATPGCQSVLVVLDGAPSQPGVLQDIPPQMIRSIEYIPPILAGTRYGVRSGYGVLEVTTMAGGG